MVASIVPTPGESDEAFFERIRTGQSAIGGRYKPAEYAAWLKRRTAEIANGVRDPAERIAELLAANNALVDRARAAETKAAYLAGAHEAEMVRNAQMFDELCHWKDRAADLTVDKDRVFEAICKAVATAINDVAKRHPKAKNLGQFGSSAAKRSVGPIIKALQAPGAVVNAATLRAELAECRRDNGAIVDAAIKMATAETADDREKAEELLLGAAWTHIRAQPAPAAPFLNEAGEDTATRPLSAKEREAMLNGLVAPPSDDIMPELLKELAELPAGVEPSEDWKQRLCCGRKPCTEWGAAREGFVCREAAQIWRMDGPDLRERLKSGAKPEGGAA